MEQQPNQPNPVTTFNINKQLEFAGILQNIHSGLLVFTMTSKIDPPMRDFMLFHLDGIAGVIKANTAEPVKPAGEPS